MPVCNYCRAAIPPKVHPYTLKLELFPAIEPSLNFTAADLAADHEAEMRRLIEQMNRMSDAEVAAQEKLVYIAHQFTLCPACRHRIAQDLERLMPPAE
jgi:hypothetical protein